jgi:hypothetical protein
VRVWMRRTWYRARHRHLALVHTLALIWARGGYRLYKSGLGSVGQSSRVERRERLSQRDCMVYAFFARWQGRVAAVPSA